MRDCLPSAGELSPCDCRGDSCFGNINMAKIWICRVWQLKITCKINPPDNQVPSRNQRPSPGVRGGVWCRLRLEIEIQLIQHLVLQQQQPAAAAAPPSPWSANKGDIAGTRAGPGLVLTHRSIQSFSQSGRVLQSQKCSYLKYNYKIFTLSRTHALLALNSNCCGVAVKSIICRVHHITWLTSRVQQNMQDYRTIGVMWVWL